jgi:crossover junction endodeoxyribonuclease RuvC
MVVLGIDPGLANTGFGVVAREGARMVARDGGVIETRAGSPVERRLAALAARLRELLSAHECDAVALEEVYFGHNAHSAFAVGQARGVALLIAGERGIPCFSYTPQQVKAAVCGSGRAGKEQVARMVQTLLALPRAPAHDHASDALAVAVCHVNGAPLAGAVAVALAGTGGRA